MATGQSLVDSIRAAASAHLASVQASKAVSAQIAASRQPAAPAPAPQETSSEVKP